MASDPASDDERSDRGRQRTGLISLTTPEILRDARAGGPLPSPLPLGVCGVLGRFARSRLEPVRALEEEAQVLHVPLAAVLRVVVLVVLLDRDVREVDERVVELVERVRVPCAVGGKRGFARESISEYVHPERQ